MRKWFQNTAVKQGVVLFLTLRLLLTLWAAAVTTVLPPPQESNETLRPYLGQPILTEGITGTLLGPWQRFDTNHYLRIAQQSYADESDSVFPPLYPLLIRTLGTLLGGTPTADLAAALLLSNLAAIGLFILLAHISGQLLGNSQALRAVVYFALFPTGFFLFAGYSESLFILLALASLWLGKNGRFWWAGIFGLLASLTRLTGWVLAVPLAYAFITSQHGAAIRKWLPFPPQFQIPNNQSPITNLFAILLPALGSALFLALRWALGLRPLGQIYADYWYQTTGIPGADLVTAVQTIFFGGTARAGEFTLIFDLFVVIFLGITTVQVWRRFGAYWGLYNAMLLLFILLPTSELKPLYSFSRYALAFIPSFWLLAEAGERPFLNRLILYPSIVLYLWFSGQFFVWGWVA